jgi:hypothetical protein
MILVGVGTDGDQSVSDSVHVLRQVSNAFRTQIHDPVRVGSDAISVAINAETEKRIVFVSHGCEESLIDASVHRMPYLGKNDIAILRDCYVFAHACSTGAELGKEAVAEALVYIGFDSTISAPPTEQSVCFGDILDIYRNLIAFIQDVEYVGPQSTECAVKQFLDRIGRIASDIEAKYDDADGSTLDAEEIICVRQFKNDMCGWVQGGDQMLKPTGAPTSLYLW